MKKPLNLVTFAITLSLLSCTQTPIDSSSSSMSEIDSEDSSTINMASFEGAINATKDNFQLDIYTREIDNLASYLNQYCHKNIRYDGANSIYWQKYMYCRTDEKDEFEKKLDIDDNYMQTVFYLENGNVLERFKNEDDVWKQFSYKPTFSFEKKITDYILVDHFEKGDDGFFYLKKEYLGTEECSFLTGYSGSFSYLNQDFDYVGFSIKNGKLDEYKYKVKFTDNSNASFNYDADVEATGKFTNIGDISLSLPDLPVYAEDLLPEQPALEEAKTKTEKNYTYKEKYSITDEEGNTTSYDFIEQVNNRSFRYYLYSDYAGCYADSYTYDVTSIAFSGNAHTTTYDTTIYYYDDHTEYYTNDMDIQDDSVSAIEIMGSSFGTKIYEYNEDGDYYTPRREKPERYNPNNNTYLDYASKCFIHGVYGEYTSSTGTSYHYDFDDLRFYLNESGLFSKASYEYDLTITEKGVAKKYKVTGNGEFSNIGTTSFDVPSDPNNDIEIDSRLQGVFDSMDLNNYTYEETSSIYDENDEKIELFGIEDEPVYDNILNESRNGRDVSITRYGYVPKVNNQDEYDVELVDEYFHYGDCNLIQTYKLKNYDQLYFNYPGTYKFEPAISSLKEYLKYFKFVRTKTINGQEANVFTLPDIYAKLYGKSLIASIDQNASITFNSINLTTIGNDIYQLSYEYYYYNDDKYIGVCSGKIKIHDFGTSKIEIPNFNESDYEVTSLDDFVNKVSDGSYYFKNSARISYFSNRTICNYSNLDNKTYSLTNEQEKEFYFNDEHDVCLDMSIDGTDYLFNVMSNMDLDISKIEQNKFYCDSNGSFILKDEYKEEFIKDVLPLESKFGEGNVQAQKIQIDIKKSTMIIDLNYTIRFLLENGKYVVFYISQSILISKLPIISL